MSLNPPPPFSSCGLSVGDGAPLEDEVEDEETDKDEVEVEEGRGAVLDAAIVLIDTESVSVEAGTVAVVIKSELFISEAVAREIVGVIAGGVGLTIEVTAGGVHRPSL